MKLTEALLYVMLSSKIFYIIMFIIQKFMWRKINDNINRILEKCR